MRHLAVPLLVLTALGCASEPEKMTVSGKVTALNPATGKRQPVVMGQVCFWHLASDKQFSTEIQPDGTYEVQVPFGEVKVFVESNRPEREEVTEPPDPADPPQVRPDPRKWLPIPKHCTVADTTPLKLEVKTNPQTYNIDLPRGEVD